MPAGGVGFLGIAGAWGDGAGGGGAPPSGPAGGGAGSASAAGSAGGLGVGVGVGVGVAGGGPLGGVGLPAPPHRVAPLPLVTAGGATAPVVHRDIKTENILVARDGFFALTDFGLAVQVCVPAYVWGGLEEGPCSCEGVSRLCSCVEVDMVVAVVGD